MDKHNLYHFYATLIHKKLRKTLSPEEWEQLEDWLSEDPKNKAFYDHLISEDFIDQQIKKLESIDSDRSFKRLESSISSKNSVPVYRQYWFKKIASLAAVLALVITAWTMLQSLQNISPHGGNSNASLIADAEPGKDKAVLIFSNGEKIDLEEISEGNSQFLAGMQVTRKKDFVAIRMDKNMSFQGERYSKIIVPNGGKYKVELQDGTKVWLNSASSLSFPTEFEPNKREVSLSGEAYFEVAHNPKSPFTVDANGTQVRVLGTHFNIKAYKNEEITKTTLLEGKVEVVHKGETKVLEPGFQAISGVGLEVSRVATREVIAWKEGYFMFQSTRLDEILRQLERWYNIKVDRKDQIPLRHFNASIDMNTKLSKVIEVLELSGGIDFEFKNGILYVTEKD
ncbi:DUF4974 domain-containing protein [Echinicola sediminis]